MWHCSSTLHGSLDVFGGTEKALVIMARNDLRSQSLDLLRFPLAIVVLTIHIFSNSGFTIQGVHVSLDNMPILLEVNHFIDAFLRRQSVPIYFFISGYVFFLGIKLTKEIYIKKLKNRVKSLLIPYIFWNTLFVLKQLFLLLPCFYFIFPNACNAQFDFSLSAILNSFWDNAHGIVDFPSIVHDTQSKNIMPIDVPLWFVRDLMIVVLCAPLIYWILKRTRYLLVVVLGVLWFVLDSFYLEHINQLIIAFFFFTFGAYMSVNEKDMMHEFNHLFKPSMILYPTLALLFVVAEHYLPEFSDTIKRVNIIVGLFFAYNLASWLLKNKICKVNPFLTSSSFFIYVTHWFVCHDVVKLMFYVLRPTSDLGMLSVYLLSVVATVGLLLFTFYLLQKFTPRLLGIISGRK